MGAQELTLGAGGNCGLVLTDDGTYKYYYDCENRLIDVNDVNDAAVATYSYDYLGRRIIKTIHDSQTTIHYTYDGDQVIAEYDGNNTLLRKFIYGPGIDEPICMIDVADSNTVYYYHFDGLGSVVALSDSSGSIVEQYSYDVFGEPTIRDANDDVISDSNYSNPYMFTGRRFDAETGLYHYRARYYAYDIGRFLQTDPVGYFAGLNLYTYCRNNPIGWIDPFGLCAKDSDSSLPDGLGPDKEAWLTAVDITSPGIETAVTLSADVITAVTTSTTIAVSATFVSGTTTFYGAVKISAKATPIFVESYNPKRYNVTVDGKLLVPPSEYTPAQEAMQKAAEEGSFWNFIKALMK